MTRSEPHCELDDAQEQPVESRPPAAHSDGVSLQPPSIDWKSLYKQLLAEAKAKSGGTHRTAASREQTSIKRRRGAR